MAKQVTPNYSELRESDVMFAHKKGKPNDVFPVYYLGYDPNWDEQQWTDGEGETFGDQELIFVDGKGWTDKHK